MKRKYIVISVIVLLITGISYYVYHHYFKVSSDNKKAKAAQETVTTVQPKKVDDTLFYSGTIAPLMIHNVTSPIAGTVTKVNFTYGQPVKKDQLLVNINSERSEQSYRDALAGYLKAKDSYESAKSKFISSQDLYKDGLIPRNDLDATRSALENDLLAFRQSTFALKSSIEKITSDKAEQDRLFNILTGLKLGDKKVGQALNLQLSNIKLYAEKSGIALFQNKSSDHNETSTITVGSEIKPGQVILNVGNLSGVSIDISVNEMNINKIKQGQKAIVTGAAFPGLALNGYVEEVGVEAKSDNSSTGLPSFPVKIVVPKLTAKEQKLIHIGMSAKVKLILTNPNMIMVAINAVQQKPDGNYLTIIRNNQKQTVKVTTGITTLNEVAITSGLNPGDKVVSPNQTK